MALLDFLKNKKGADKAKTKKTAEKKPENVSVAKKSGKTVPIDVPKSQNKNVKAFSYNIIQEPHISEKATDLAEKHKYTFKVYGNANKPEIKKSVEGIYNVDVLDVNIIKIPHKKRRLGKTEGFKKGFTKALVTIKKGQRIEII